MLSLAKILSNTPLSLRSWAARGVSFKGAAALIEQGEDGSIVRLLEAGMNPDLTAQRAPFSSLLITAAEQRRPLMVYSLLIHGADPNQRVGPDQVTALHALLHSMHAQGTYFADTDCLRYLLEYGADPLLPDGGGITPFYLALRLKLWPMARLLAAAAPDVGELFSSSAAARGGPKS